MNAVLTTLHLSKNNKKEISLTDEFFYPKYGCGQIWNVLANKIQKMGGEIIYGAKVTGLTKTDNRITNIIYQTKDGNYSINADYIISSASIKDLISYINDVPAEIQNIAFALPYRDYILAGLYLNKLNLKNNTKIKTLNNICPDNWIYLQDGNIRAGRMQIMNNWSPFLVRDFKKNVFISMEYFASEGDDLWKKTEDEMFKTVLNDLKSLNITEEKNILDKVIIKVKKAYPAYFGSYSEFHKVRDYLDNITNLYCIGRNGQHKYNNMDHSMLSGIMSAKIIRENGDKKDLWDINTDSVYQEH